ncbi:MAG: hypothetical protein AAFY71_00245 [Bacteroidota bacterium]
MKSSLLFILLCAIVVLTSCRSAKFLTHEMDIFITAEDFKEFGFKFTDLDKMEKFKKRVWLDKSVEYEYEYPKSDEEKAKLSIYNNIDIQPSPEDAAVSYDLSKKGLRPVIESASRRVDPTYYYGEESSLMLFQDEEGNPTGNLFIFYKGKVVYTLLIVGYGFDKLEEWKRFLKDELEAIDRLADQT